MITVVDIECTSRDKSPSPYKPENYLVSVGIQTDEGSEYICFRHDDESHTVGGRELLQSALDKCTLLVGHNIKFDLSWILECGFEYSGPIYDTMIFEFLKVGGDPSKRLNLSASCARYGLPVKTDEASILFNEGIGFESMPWHIVEEYGRNDVDITWMLYHKQMEAIHETSA